MRKANVNQKNFFYMSIRKLLILINYLKQKSNRSFDKLPKYNRFNVAASWDETWQHIINLKGINKTIRMFSFYKYKM